MNLETRIRAAIPACDGWSARIVTHRDQAVSIHRGVVRPPRLQEERGVHLTLQVGEGRGYAATGDLTASGLQAAAQRALDWAEQANHAALFDASLTPFATAVGSWTSPRETLPADVPFGERIAYLKDAAAPFDRLAAIVDWTMELWSAHTTSRLITSNGGDVLQDQSMIVPFGFAFANDGADTLVRSTGRHNGFQGGFEDLLASGFDGAPGRIVEDLKALLAAPVCPKGQLDLVLAADQMVLQIHESIGHPLEMDRLLGDERNFAGTTFVTADMVGSYAYGSPLLNVSFAPDVDGELSCFAWDDDGSPATRERLIEGGILKRLLGGATSQQRSGLPGVSCSRSSSWTRPTMDRMANLNLEPGNQSLADLIGSVDNGIFMETNQSWSIDERRDKFQFGCEMGRRIVNGELGEVVRKPNYRGRSKTFWRNLAGVGDPSTFEVLGTPFCGKGEPSQVVMVGHATPPALFRDIAVFGGA